MEYAKIQAKLGDLDNWSFEGQPSLDSHAKAFEQLLNARVRCEQARAAAIRRSTSFDDEDPFQSDPFDDDQRPARSTPAPSSGHPGPPGPPGPMGVMGIAGRDGEPGVGVPAGGLRNQFLVKRSDADFDTEWVYLPPEAP